MGAPNNFLLYLTLFIVLSICISHHGVFAFGAGTGAGAVEQILHSGTVWLMMSDSMALPGTVT